MFLKFNCYFHIASFFQRPENPELLHLYCILADLHRAKCEEGGQRRQEVVSKCQSLILPWNCLEGSTQ